MGEEPALQADPTSAIQPDFASQVPAHLRELEDFKAALDAHAIVAIADAHGRITYVNDKFCSISKWSREELLGRDHRIINSGHHSKAFIRDLWDTIRSGQVWKGELKNRAKDGQIYWVDTTIVPTLGADGKPFQYVAIRAEITARKLLEERNAEILSALRVANRELNDFAYSVSHDLKAPLRGITGYAEELERKHKDGLSKRALFCQSQILVAARNLDRLIEDLLHFARLGDAPLSLEDVDLRRMIAPILRDRHLMLAEHGVEVSVDVADITLRTWSRGLTQVLTNLIDNALKYSRDASPPHVCIRAVESAAGWEIVVSDNGIGFDMKYHDRIYGLFSRLVRSEEFEGTGAGLAIVKKLLDKLGGSIRAESEPGKGASFHVELPRPQPGSDAATSAVPS
jgi:chemotaxis family two-component system sensor kinase Cph1